jgi:hypothetical protein
VTPYLRCDDVKLADWLMSNPPPAYARKSTMLLVCGGRAFDWPMVADGYDEGKQRGMEAA